MLSLDIKLFVYKAITNDCVLVIWQYFIRFEKIQAKLNFETPITPLQIVPSYASLWSHLRRRICTFEPIFMPRRSENRRNNAGEITINTACLAALIMAAHAQSMVYAMLHSSVLLYTKDQGVIGNTMVSEVKKLSLYIIAK